MKLGKFQKQFKINNIVSISSNERYVTKDSSCGFSINLSMWNIADESLEEIEKNLFEKKYDQTLEKFNNKYRGRDQTTISFKTSNNSEFRYFFKSLAYIFKTAVEFGLEKILINKLTGLLLFQTLKGYFAISRIIKRNYDAKSRSYQIEEEIRYNHSLDQKELVLKILKDSKGAIDLGKILEKSKLDKIIVESVLHELMNNGEIYQPTAMSFKAV